MTATARNRIDSRGLELARARHVIGAVAVFASSGASVERATAASAPTAFRIWKAGANVTDHGIHLFTARSAELLAAQQGARGNLFVIDVDHLSLSESAPPESRKAVGWHRLEVRESADGPELWATDVEWTSAVRAGLEQDPPEWRYFSPAYDVSKKDGEILSYTNTALTNNPATWSVTTLATASKATGRSTMMTKEEMIAALAAWAGDDEDKKEKARAEIAALFPDDEEEKEEKKAAEVEGEEKKEEKKATEAEGEEKKEEKKATSSTLDSAMIRRLEELERDATARRADDEKKEREAIFASRPDISASTKKILASEKPARVRELLASIEVPKSTTRANTLASVTSITRGQSQTGGAGTETIQASRVSEQADELDQKMGLAPARSAIRREGNSIVFGVMTPADAKAAIAAKKGAVK